MKFYKVLLDVFDGDGSATGAAGAEGSSEGSEIGAEYFKDGNTGHQSGEDLSKMKFGKEAPTEPQEEAGDAGQKEQTEETPEERRNRYKALVNGEFKDEYTKDTQRIIDKRFKDMKALQAKVDKTQPLVDMLMDKYAITDGDLTKLQAAIDADDQFLAERAEQEGFTPEQYKRLYKLEQRNRQFEAAEEQRMRENEANARAEKWYHEGEALKAKYPDFDIQTEIQDESFKGMLRAGVPMEHAYKVIHMDDLMQDAVRTAAERTEKRVVDNIRAKGTRPKENGRSSGSAYDVAADPSRWNDDQMEEVLRRVRRGEKIYL